MTIISDLFITDVQFCLTKLLFIISLHQICIAKSVSLSKTEQISRPLLSVLLQTIFDYLKFRVGDHAFFISLPPQYINYLYHPERCYNCLLRQSCTYRRHSKSSKSVSNLLKALKLLILTNKTIKSRTNYFCYCK